MSDQYWRTTSQCMQQILVKYSESPLYDLLRYHLGWIDSSSNPLTEAEAKRFGGKRTRAFLCLRICEILSGSCQPALQAGAAIEFLQDFTLLLDDIQDGDEFRRGRTAVWKLWGIPKALNAAGLLQVVAYEAALFQDQSHSVGHHLVGLFLKATRRLFEGQAIDVSLSLASRISLTEYMRMLGQKTGTLFGLAFQVGGNVGGADALVQSKLFDAGDHAGVAYSVLNDIMGIWGSEQETGKILASDLINRRITLPVVYAIASAGAAVREAVKAYFKSSDKSETSAQRVASLLLDAGAKEYCWERAEEYLDSSRRLVSGLELAQAQIDEIRRLLDAVPAVRVGGVLAGVEKLV